MGFLDLFGARYALKMLVLVASIGLFVFLAGVVNGLLAGIVAAMPEDLGGTAAYFLPSNTGACIAALITATIARWAYDFQRTRLMMVGNG